jgi:hypothetical protein
VAANFPISQDNSNPYSECDIRQNHDNPLQILAGANNNNYTSGFTNTQAQFYSSDGGITWAQSNLPPVTGDSLQGDPACEWTSDGTAWVLTLGISSTLSLVLRSFKSSNGGKDWTHDSEIGSSTAADRPTFQVDHSSTSAFKDNMYVTWHQAAGAFVSVRKGPGGTWSTPAQVSGSETTFTAYGGDVKTNADGDVFVFWPNAGGQTVLMVKSTDGGTTFNALGATPVQIATTFASFIVDIPAEDTRGCRISVSGGAYKTATLDMVYACWMDLSGGTGCNSSSDGPGSDASSTCKTRIWFSLSSDGGKTWKTPVKINDQSSLNDQFFPRLVVDDTTGNVMIVYYDTVNDSSRLKTDIWMQCSIDNGASWTKAVKITSAETDETSDSDNGNQYGDYIGLSVGGGQYFACWTDRRNGGNEQIYASEISVPFSYFIVDKNTFGVDEVNDSSSYANAFSVAVEGASPNSLGSATPTLSGPFNAIPTITKSTSPLPFPTYADATDKDTPQRIVFTYNIDFPSGATVPPFPVAGPPPDFVTFELDSAISFPGFTAKPLPASTLFELVAGEDPYFTNINPSIDNPFYLSQDLRVFTLTPGLPGLNNVMSGPQAFTPTGGTAFTARDPAAAYSYIQGLLNYLNNPANGYTNPQGTDPFTLFLDQGNFLTADSTVSPNSPNPGDPSHPWTNYNFAVARVRLIGNTGDKAQGVKVFFRLFIAETFDTNYDTTNYYPFNPDPAGLPGSPTPGPGNQTYPFFATGDFSNATENSDYGTGGANNQTITVHSGDVGGTWAYFGCFLNVYDSSIQSTVLAAGTHQCLVAQIAYDDAPIENSATITYSPENSDKLAQRNLNIVPAASPHRIPSSFDTKPSPPVKPGARGILGYPDELMISWGNTPRGSTASIYWPQVNANDVLELASTLYATNFISASDPNTLQCPVTGDVTYIPIPPGVGSNFAGLFTVDLPSHVVRGHEYTVTVRRLSTKHIGDQRRISVQGRSRAVAAAVRHPIGEWRYIVGTFQVKIPVSTKELILRPEENTLAILKWRLERMAASNRWYPVLQRLVRIIAGRVQSLGGDPHLIPPSLTGYHPGPAHGLGKGHEEFTGKVIAITYDRFGDFEGFRLLTEEGHEMAFHGREPEVESLIYRAWEERILITVRVHTHDRHWPASIIYRRPH